MLALKYLPRCRHLTLLDLMEEGGMGLTKGVELYDYHRGMRLSTYARYWIKQAIGNAIKTRDRSIRLPAQRIEELGRISYFKNDYWKINERAPTIDEIQREFNTSQRSVERIENIPGEPISLSTPVGEDGDSALGDFLADEHYGNFVPALEGKELRERLEGQLRRLHFREEDVLRRRFGLTPDGREWSLEEIGQNYGVTRERIRQIEARALQELRHSSRAGYLEVFLSET